MTLAACGGGFGQGGSIQVGESCTKTADCLNGARCVGLVCTGPAIESNEGRCNVDSECVGTIYGAFCEQVGAGTKGFCRCRSAADCTTAMSSGTRLPVRSTQITQELPRFCSDK